MKVVIMAGGKGTRISSVASDIPKPMIKVEGIPVLEREIECLKNQGFDDIILTVSHLGNIIMDYFGDGSGNSPVTGEPFGVHIDYYFEEEPLGNAGALFKIKDKLTSDFLLLNIWDGNKVRTAVDGLKSIDTPAMSCCNYRLTDGDLNVALENAIKQKPLFTPIRSLLYNEIPGCCMALNKPLMDKLKEIQIDNAMMHDSMALLLATYIGTVVYDESPRICHRIHGANVVGAGHKKIIPAKWIKEKWRLLRYGDDYDISALAGEVLRVSGENSDSKYKKDLELLRDFKKSFGNTLKLLRHPETKGNLFDRTVMSIRSKILFHVF